MVIRGKQEAGVGHYMAGQEVENNDRPKSFWQDHLTHRECEILTVYAQCANIHEASASLEIAEQTIKNTLYRIYDKMQVVNGRNAIYHHFFLGLLASQYCHIHREDS